MPQPSKELSEKQLAETFEKVQREVSEQIRQFEQAYPDLGHPQENGDEVVQQPVFAYDVHAVN